MKINMSQEVKGRLYTTGPANQHLKDLIDLATENLPHVIKGAINTKQITRLKQFFEEYYVKVNLRGFIAKPIFPPDLKFSTYEARIINYLIEPVGETGILVLHGHSGVGKTTMLRYIIHWLHSNHSDFNSACLPIYINISADDPNIDTLPKMKKYIRKRVYEENFSKIYKYNRENYKSILLKLHDDPVFSSWCRGNFHKNKIEEISTEGFEKFFEKLSEKRKADFIMDGIIHFSINDHTPVHIVLDDIDKYPKKIHEITFKALDYFTRKGFYALASMRTSSFFSLDTEILQKQDIDEGPIVFDMNVVRQILLKRVKNANKIISLRPPSQIHLSNLNEITSTELVNSFVDIVSTDKSVNTLVNLSNLNIKSLFRKLRLISKSTFFDDSYLSRELLSRWTLPKSKRYAGARLWIVLSLLFSNYKGTFRSHPDSNKCGIVNLFDCPGSFTNPLKHFCNLHILGYLFRRRVSEDEYFSNMPDNFAEVRTLYTAYKNLFDFQYFDRIFFRTMFGLIESHLVYTESCSVYKDTKENANLLMLDKICISGAGLFYFTNLLHKIEYIYFIKDDIDWVGNPFEYGLIAADKEVDRLKKFQISLRTMRILMEIELELLSMLAEKSERLGTGRELIDYRERFSAYYPHVNHNDVLFTKLFSKNMVSYLKRAAKNSFRGPIANEVKHMELLIKEHKGLIKSFLT